LERATPDHLGTLQPDIRFSAWIKWPAENELKSQDTRNVCCHWKSPAGLMPVTLMETQPCSRKILLAWLFTKLEVKCTQFCKGGEKSSRAKMSLKST